jgi:hypothetical protein
VLARRPEREDRAAVGTAVDELSADLGGNARQIAEHKGMLLALDHERKPALEDQVDLFLVQMPVYPALLPWPQQDQVDSKARYTERASQRNEALTRIEV